MYGQAYLFPWTRFFIHKDLFSDVFALPLFTLTANYKRGLIFIHERKCREVGGRADLEISFFELEHDSCVLRVWSFAVCTHGNIVKSGHPANPPLLMCIAVLGGGASKAFSSSYFERFHTIFIFKRYCIIFICCV